MAVGRDLVFGHYGVGLKADLVRRGYTVYAVSLWSFGRGGGPAPCVTPRLDTLIAAMNGQP